MFSKQISTYLKGVAILLVIIGHVLQNYHVSNFQVRFGSWGVAIFLILSGYGLVQSHRVNSLRQFVSKRLKRVWLPYVIVVAAAIVVSLIFFREHIDLSTYVKVLAGMDLDRSFVPNYWFVSFIILWYAVFYLVFRIFSKNSIRVAALFVIAFLSYVILSLTEIGARMSGGVLYQFILHIFEFPLGVAIGIYGSSMYQGLTMEKRSRYAKLGFCASLVIFTFCYFALQLRVLPGSMFQSVHGAEGVTFSAVLIGLFLVFNARGIIFSLLEKVGVLSYEMYLVHTLILRKLKILDAFDNQVLGIIIFVILVIVFSQILKKVTGGLARQKA